jgi:glutaryl-CoA dehydrogenase
MLGDVTAMQLYCIRLGRLIDDGKLEETRAALARRPRRQRHHARFPHFARLGAAVVHVIRNMCDMESLVTYEGTAEIQSPLVGRDITGLSAFV